MKMKEIKVMAICAAMVIGVAGCGASYSAETTAAAKAETTTVAEITTTAAIETETPGTAETSSEATTAADVEVTRTYTVENALDTPVTELYVYRTDGTEKGENLAGEGLAKGDQIQIEVSGYMLHSPNETLYTVEYVADGKEYSHGTLHVEDLTEIIYLIGVDGVSSATPLSFGEANMKK